VNTSASGNFKGYISLNKVFLNGVINNGPNSLLCNRAAVDGGRYEYSYKKLSGKKEALDVSESSRVR
jgi:hypothetical protein